MGKVMDRRELRLRHAVQSLRQANVESERMLELQVIDKLIEIFKDDKEGLLQALRLAKINGVEDTKRTEPVILYHQVRSRL